MNSRADDAPGADHNRAERPPRRIADFLDPTFAGDPTADADFDERSATDENIAIVEGDLGDVLQMTEPSSPLDVFNDPEDELLDLPAEEEAMHVVPEET